MQWSDDYSIGVKRVDLQHQKMLGMIDDFCGSLADGMEGHEVGNAIKFMVDYTKYHFHDEEKVMRAIGFTEIEAHRQRHQEFIDKVTSILLDLRNGDGCNYAGLAGFLVNWMLTHILEEDVMIGRQLRQRLSPEEQAVISRPQPEP